ncbi:MAG: molybdate ABC transporter substrate-binding protein [Aliishimia sp.]
MINNPFQILMSPKLATLSVLLSLAVAGPVRAAETGLIFAAASLSEALSEVANSLDDVPSLSFGGSGAIARQIDQGAPADVILLASPIWMDWLEQRGHLQAGSRQAPFGNRLVLIGPPDANPLTELTQNSLKDRLGRTGRLAIGEHRAVPAGQYAATWLQSKSLWSALRPHLAETENVRAVLALVARAEAPLGLVYASDLVAVPNAASEVWTIPQSEQPEIRYALAAISAKGIAMAAQLTSPEALAIFARYGFDIEAAE